MSTENLIESFTVNIANLLKQLGSATPAPFGLRGRPAFDKSYKANDTLPQMKWEDPLLDRCATWLHKSEFGAFEVVRSTTHPRYPSYVTTGRRKADLKYTRAGAQWAWVEATTAYLHDLRCDPSWPPDWSGAEFVSDIPGIERGLEAFTQVDCVSLEQLNATDATDLVALILGFDREDDSLDGWVSSLVAKRLKPRGWVQVPLNSSENCWPDSYKIRARNGYRERLWVWHKSVPSG